MDYDERLLTGNEEVDLGIAFSDEFTFESHIYKCIKKANCRLGLIKRSFNYLNVQSFKILYKAFIRPLVEYGSVIWSPSKKSLIRDIEKIQKRATKLVGELSHLTYEQRLRRLNLDTLYYRRIRADIIQIFRIVKGIDNITLSNAIIPNNRRSRGHEYKLTKIRCNKRLKSNAFPHRVLDIWNNLPQEVVKSNSMNSFKNAISNLWQNWDIKRDFSNV